MAARLDALMRDVALLLGEAGIENHRREARLLLEHFGGADAAEILANRDRVMTPEICEAAFAAARRRAGGEPLHRIIGRRAFYDVDLTLSPATLEPRPDTEILVDRIIPHARRIIASRGACRLLDLGTGTGAIALAVLKEVDGVTALGVDIAEGAVAVARENAQINGLGERFETMTSDWFVGVNEKFHIIVSNPPYIADSEFASLPDDVRRFDPKTALIGGEDGLEAYRAIAQSAADYLLPDGIIGVEIGHTQREAVSALFATQGYTLIEHARDLAGQDRALLFSPFTG